MVNGEFGASDGYSRCWLAKRTAEEGTQLRNVLQTIFRM